MSVLAQIIEMKHTDKGLSDNPLGYVCFPENPVERKRVAFHPDADAQVAGPPIKINGGNYLIISHTWDVEATIAPGDAHEAILILLVQSIDVPKETGIEVPRKPSLIIPN